LGGRRWTEAEWLKDAALARRRAGLKSLAEDLETFAARLVELANIARVVDARKVPLLTPELLSLKLSPIWVRTSALVAEAAWSLQGFGDPGNFTSVLASIPGTDETKAGLVADEDS
jgi:hypothetical protein